MKTNRVHQLALFLDEAQPNRRVPTGLRELVSVANRLRNSRLHPGPHEPDSAFVQSLRDRLLGEEKAVTEEVAVRYSWVKMPHGVPGRLYYAYTKRGICATNNCRTDREFENYFAKRYGFQPAYDLAPPVDLRSQVEAWVDPRQWRQQKTAADFDLFQVTDFERRVLELAARIPRGEVRPYNWLAKEVGNPGASRAVGSVMARNPIPFLIPCHRVVRADAHIGNYGCGGPKVKRWLLAWERVKLDRLAEAANRGAKLVGSDTTKIYCLPGCRHAQRVSPEHRAFFASVGLAERAGYRACKSCRPV